MALCCCLDSVYTRVVLYIYRQSPAYSYKPPHGRSRCTHHTEAVYCDHTHSNLQGPFCASRIQNHNRGNKSSPPRSERPSYVNTERPASAPSSGIQRSNSALLSPGGWGIDEKYGDGNRHGSVVSAGGGVGVGCDPGVSSADSVERVHSDMRRAIEDDLHVSTRAKLTSSW